MVSWPEKVKGKATQLQARPNTGRRIIPKRDRESDFQRKPHQELRHDSSPICGMDQSTASEKVSSDPWWRWRPADIFPKVLRGADAAASAVVGEDQGDFFL